MSPQCAPFWPLSTFVGGCMCEREPATKTEQPVCGGVLAAAWIMSAWALATLSWPSAQKVACTGAASLDMTYSQMSWMLR